MSTTTRDAAGSQVPPSRGPWRRMLVFLAIAVATALGLGLLAALAWGLSTGRLAGALPSAARIVPNVAAVADAASGAPATADLGTRVATWLPSLLGVLLAISVLLRPRQWAATLVEVTRLVGRLAKSAVTNARLKGLVGLAVFASIAISIASWATTFMGTLSFFGPAPVQVMFGLLLSLGIQSILFLASWIVAEEWVAHGRASRRLDDRDSSSSWWRRWFLARHADKTAVLAVCMLTSIFFSFASHFLNVYGPERLELANLQYAQADVTRVLTSAEKAIRDERDEVLGGLRKLDAWIAFNKSLEDLLETARTQPNRIHDALARQQDQIKTAMGQTDSALKAAVDKQVDLTTKLGAAKAAAEAAPSAKSGDLSAQIASLDTELRALRDQKDHFEEALQNEGSIGNRPEDIPEGDCRAKAETEKTLLQAPSSAKPASKLPKKGGQAPAALTSNGRTTAGLIGPVATCLKENVVQLTNKVATVQSELSKASAEAEDNVRRIAAAQAGVGGYQTELNSIAGDIERLTGEKERENKEFEALSKTNAAIGADGQSDAIIKVIGAYRDEFLRSGAKATFDRVVANCVNLQQILSDPKNTMGGTPAAPGACETAAFASTVDRLDVLDGALKNFHAACGIDEAFSQFKKPYDYFVKGKTCLALAKVPARTTREAAIVDEIAQINDPHASNFERSIASLGRGDRLAWLALGLAICVDVIVLLVAFLGANFAASPMLRDVSSPQPGQARDQSAIHDIWASLADLRLHGDEYDDRVRAAKMFVGACRKEPRASDFLSKDEMDREKSTMTLDLRRVNPSYRERVEHVANSAYGHVFALPGRPLCFDVAMPYFLHLVRIVGDFERERELKNGARPHTAGPSGEWTFANDDGPGATAATGPRSAEESRFGGTPGGIGDHPPPPPPEPGRSNQPGPRVADAWEF